MQDLGQKNLIIAPHGYVKKLSEITGFERHTVTRALRGGTGKKAERIRKLYYKMYLQPTIEQL